MKRSLVICFMIGICVLLCACGNAAPAAPEADPELAEKAELAEKYASLIGAMEAGDYETAIFEIAENYGNETEITFFSDTTRVSIVPLWLENRIWQTELLESGYRIEDGTLHYSVAVYNGNDELVLTAPVVRVTATDAEGKVIGTVDQKLGPLYPKEAGIYCFRAFSLDETPANVSIEILPCEESAIKNISELRTYFPLELYDTFEEGNVYRGEVVNNNPYDVKAQVCVVYRNFEGVSLGGEAVVLDRIEAGTAVEFEIYGTGTEGIAAVEFYASILE